MEEERVMISHKIDVTRLLARSILYESILLLLPEFFLFLFYFICFIDRLAKQSQKYT